MKAFFIDENNSLKSNIENLLKWCEKKEKNEELGRTYFNNGILLMQMLFEMGKE